MFGFARSAPVKTVSPAEALSLSGKGNAYLIHVREAAEWAEGRISGTMHLPLSAFKQRADTLPPDKPTIFYCRSGGRSAQAIGVCLAAGMTQHDTHMAGGISAWIANGFKLVR